jgi:hypothetical protein
MKSKNKKYSQATRLVKKEEVKEKNKVDTNPYKKILFALFLVLLGICSRK